MSNLLLKVLYIIFSLHTSLIVLKRENIIRENFLRFKKSSFDTPEYSTSVEYSIRVHLWVRNITGTSWEFPPKRVSFDFSWPLP